MSTFIIRRIGVGLLTLLLVSIVVFILSRAIGDPVTIYASETATKEDRAILAAALGLDRPLYEQYLTFMANAFLHGDLGQSLRFSRPVSELVFGRLWNTLQLASVAFVISVAISIPIGVLAAVRRGTWLDWLARGFAFFGQSLPGFWLGIMLILVFAVNLNLLPPGGKGGPETFLMPALALGWASAAAVTRLVRSSMLEILSSDFIRTARSKGLNELVVMQRHALKNALIPTVAYCTVTLIRSLVIGSIAIETVFGWPGMGRLAYEATIGRDFPTIQGVVIVVAAAVIVTNIVGDILYGWLDPRIRYS